MSYQKKKYQDASRQRSARRKKPTSTAATPDDERVKGDGSVERKLPLWPVDRRVEPEEAPTIGPM